MKGPSPTERVRAWEETVMIQTYPAPAPDRNPMFLDKRVYQGSSGKVYPNPFTDHISDSKFDKPYRAIFLETTDAVRPNYTGLMRQGYPAAFPFITAVDTASGKCELSAPLRKALAKGPIELATLKYRPFSPAETTERASGVKSTAFTGPR